ncbi:MAG TPA: phytoene/squalene synthase family protein [Polyangiaceae bacterium]|jgi:phytoene synthase|nr:phytoene/squalene synthase family protein [Polyangiaceae bacterium]
MNAQQVSFYRAVISQHSKSFAFASRLLPNESRYAVLVVYAWCRRADDAIDYATGADQKLALAKLEAELDAIEAKQPLTDRVVCGFAEVIRKYDIPLVYARALLAGMRMDVESTRYESWTDLLLYSYRVASVVGLMLCHLLGVREPKALVHAAHLGFAMQLTNIARDLKEDAERGRVYLPRRAWGVEQGALEPDEVAGKSSAELAPILKQVLDLADDYYASAWRGIGLLPLRSALAVATALVIYRAIGTRIRALNYDVMSQRVVVSTWDKIRLCIFAVFRVLRQRLGAPAFRRCSLREVTFDEVYRHQPLDGGTLAAGAWTTS